MRDLFVKASLLLCSLLGTSHLAQAQDERFLRELLTDRFYNPEVNKNLASSEYFHVVSPFYQVDLDGNSRTESLVFEKIDGKDLIHIHNYDGQRIFSAAFTPLGTSSHLFKINLRKIGKGYRALLLHYYEGSQNYIEFTGTSRLYVITFKDLSPGGFDFFKGPLLWTEHKDAQGNYLQRAQFAVLRDFNKDGMKEISVRYQSINRVFVFNGKTWIGFN